MPDIKLQNSDGSYSTYLNKSSITLPTPTGDTVDFVVPTNSTLVIKQEKVQTPFYDDSKNPPVTGHSGDLPTLTVSQQIPLTAQIEEVHLYHCFTGLILTGTRPNPVPFYSAGVFEIIDEYTAAIENDHITITASVETDSVADLLVSHALYGIMIHTGLLVVLYKTQD